MALLNLEIVTPEKRAYSGSARMVVVPGAEGELGILPDHMPLMTQILPGEVQVTTESGGKSSSVLLSTDSEVTTFPDERSHKTVLRQPSPHRHPIKSSA